MLRRRLSASTRRVHAKLIGTNSVLPPLAHRPIATSSSFHSVQKRCFNTTTTQDGTSEVIEDVGKSSKPLFEGKPVENELEIELLAADDDIGEWSSAEWPAADGSDDTEHDSNVFGSSSADGDDDGTVAGRVQYTEVKALDQFAKAKILNYIKRYSYLSTAPAFTFKRIVGFDESSFLHASLSVPVPPEFGNRVAEGLATNQKDAEILCAMHAELIIDALGLQMYALGASQKRHAENAKKAGRWAPQPDDKPRPPKTPSPPPLRVGGSGNVAGSGGTPFKCSNYSTVSGEACFSPLQLTLASPKLLNVGSRQRIKAFFGSMQKKLKKHVNVEPLDMDTSMRSGGVDGGPTSFDTAIRQEYQTKIMLPLPEVYGERIGIGRAFDRDTSITLACMHAELIIDAVGFRLYPTSDSRQAQHARECKELGRFAIEPRHVSRGEVARFAAAASPPALRIEPAEGSLKDAMANTKKTTKEEMLLSHAAVIARFTNYVQINAINKDASKHFAQYLLQRALWPEASFDPYLVERFGQSNRPTFRATATVPLVGLGQSLVSMGIADTEEDAKAAAAMHALQLLGELNISVYAKAKDQAAYARDMKQMKAAAASPTAGEQANPLTIEHQKYDSTSNAKQTSRADNDQHRIDQRKLSKPFRLVTSLTKRGRVEVGLSPAEQKEVDRLGWDRCAIGRLESFSQRDAKDIKAFVEDSRKNNADGSEWSLLPETSDGFIVLSPEASARDSVTYVHTLVSPRVMDVKARDRLVDYLERHGVNGKQAINVRSVRGSGTRSSTGVEINCLFEAKVTLPVPDGYGTRTALAQAYSASDAEILLGMHAELVLDTIGVPLFDDFIFQRRHAETAHRLGRQAPISSWHAAFFDKKTPSPPPLRKEHQQSERWQKHIQRTHGNSVSPSMATSSQVRQATVVSSNSRVQDKDAELLVNLVPMNPKDVNFGVKKQMERYFTRQGSEIGFMERYSVGKAGENLEHRAKLVVPVPKQYGHRVAFAVGPSRRDAFYLCLTHAARILNTLGIPVSGDRAAGHHAPKPGQSPSTPSPPGIRGTFTYSDDELQRFMPTPPSGNYDAREWHLYVRHCGQYIQKQQDNTVATAASGVKLPKQYDGGDANREFFIDALQAEVEKKPWDFQAHIDLKKVCEQFGLDVPPRWEWQPIGKGGPAANKRFYINAPIMNTPFFARGIGKEPKHVIAQCAMHYRAIISYMAKKNAPLFILSGDANSTSTTAKEEVAASLLVDPYKNVIGEGAKSEEQKTKVAKILARQSRADMVPGRAVWSNNSCTDFGERTLVTLFAGMTNSRIRETCKVADPKSLAVVLDMTLQPGGDRIVGTGVPPPSMVSDEASFTDLMSAARRKAYSTLFNHLRDSKSSFMALIQLGKHFPTTLRPETAAILGGPIVEGLKPTSTTTQAASSSKQCEAALMIEEVTSPAFQQMLLRKTLKNEDREAEAKKKADFFRWKEAMQSVNESGVDTVVVIASDTGLGKSTILPFALRNKDNDGDARVVVLYRNEFARRLALAANRDCGSGSSKNSQSSGLFHQMADGIVATSSAPALITLVSQLNAQRLKRHQQGNTSIIVDDFHAYSPLERKTLCSILGDLATVNLGSSLGRIVLTTTKEQLPTVQETLKLNNVKSTGVPILSSTHKKHPPPNTPPFVQSNDEYEHCLAEWVKRCKKKGSKDHGSSTFSTHTALLRVDTQTALNGLESSFNTEPLKVARVLNVDTDKLIIVNAFEMSSDALAEKVGRILATNAPKKNAFVVFVGTNDTLNAIPLPLALTPQLLLWWSPSHFVKNIGFFPLGEEARMLTYTNRSWVRISPPIVPVAEEADGESLTLSDEEFDAALMEVAPPILTSAPDALCALATGYNVKPSEVSSSIDNSSTVLRAAAIQYMTAAKDMQDTVVLSVRGEYLIKLIARGFSRDAAQLLLAGYSLGCLKEAAALAIEVEHPEVNHDKERMASAAVDAFFVATGITAPKAITTMAPRSSADLAEFLLQVAASHVFGRSAFTINPKSKTCCYSLELSDHVSFAVSPLAVLLSASRYTLPKLPSSGSRSDVNKQLLYQEDDDTPFVVYGRLVVQPTSKQSAKDLLNFRETILDRLANVVPLCEADLCKLGSALKASARNTNEIAVLNQLKITAPVPSKLIVGRFAVEDTVRAMKTPVDASSL